MPTANARLIDDSTPATRDAKQFLVQSERITDTGASKPLVQSERITDHRADAPTGSLAGTPNKTNWPAPLDDVLAARLRVALRDVLDACIAFARPARSTS